MIQAILAMATAGIVCTVPSDTPDPPHIPLYGTDTTLTEPGVPADAAAVGARLSTLSEEIAAIPSGKDGVGIQSVEQTTTSTEDGGTNVVTVTKTDGTTSTFEVRNGSKGTTPQKGTDYWTAADKQEIVDDVLAALPTWTGGNY